MHAKISIKKNLSNQQVMAECSNHIACNPIMHTFPSPIGKMGSITIKHMKGVVLTARQWNEEYISK